MLRKLVSAGDSSGVQQAANKINSAIVDDAFLCGKHVTPADIIIYSALLPVQASWQKVLHSCGTPRVNLGFDAKYKALYIETIGWC